MTTQPPEVGHSLGDDAATDWDGSGGASPGVLYSPYPLSRVDVLRLRRRFYGRRWCLRHPLKAWGLA